MANLFIFLGQVNSSWLKSSFFAAVTWFSCHFCWLAIISFSQQLNSQKGKSQQAISKKRKQEKWKWETTIPWAKQLKRPVCVPWRSSSFLHAPIAFPVAIAGKS